MICCDSVDPRATVQFLPETVPIVVELLFPERHRIEEEMVAVALVLVVVGVVVGPAVVVLIDVVIVLQRDAETEIVACWWGQKPGATGTQQLV